VSQEVFDILKAAVNIARDQQVKRLSTLRGKLHSAFPGKGDQINEAINAWSTYAQQNR